MISSPLGRASAIAAVSLLFAGCGGSSSTATLPQGPSSIHQTAQHGKSGSGDLIYAAGSNGKSYVMTYPEGKLVGTIAGTAVDACSDGVGNVYLTTSNGVEEFPHGATTPSATFEVDGASIGCAVDPTSGDLAVTYYNESGAFLAVFSDGSGQPKVYHANTFLWYCGYDDQGNLFANYGTENGMGLVELPSGGSQIVAISVNPPITQFPGRIQWDGKQLTIESGNGRKRAKGLITVKRVTLSGSTATVVGTTSFGGIKRQAQASWIFHDSIILPFGNTSETAPNLGIGNIHRAPNARKRSNIPPAEN
ncbi:MAG TPA: hypothetical protein VHS56_12550 [Candidatus Cybelea sp.]|nr:hypothetical protein [Candidatus Cybelea sp.]